MGRKPKLYIPLTVTFFDDDRIIDAGDGGALLYLAMLLACKAQGTDGRLRANQIKRLHRSNWQEELETLAALRLVVHDEVTDEWCIAAWFGHNESLESIDARRAADRDRKAAEAARRKEQETDSAKDSDRNPAGKVRESALKEREGKERKGKEGNPRGLHRFVADEHDRCVDCHLPMNSRFHLRAVEEAS